MDAESVEVKVGEKRKKKGRVIMSAISSPGDDEIKQKLLWGSRPSARAAAEGPLDHLEGFLTGIKHTGNNSKDLHVLIKQ